MRFGPRDSPQFAKFRAAEISPDCRRMRLDLDRTGHPVPAQAASRRVAVVTISTATLPEAKTGRPQVDRSRGAHDHIQRRVRLAHRFG